MGQFKEVLEAFPLWIDESPTVNEIGCRVLDHYDTIRLALRIADRIQEKPSFEMLMVADRHYTKSDSETFRAMIEQMMKEIEND